MRREIARPTETVTTIKQGNFELKDWLFILGSAAIGFFSKFLVAGIFEVGYVLAYPISFYFLLSPSDIPNKKNYQVALQVLLKDSNTYHAINPPTKEGKHEV